MVAVGEIRAFEEKGMRAAVLGVSSILALTSCVMVSEKQAGGGKFTASRGGANRARRAKW
jgi:hypothetical protein